MENPDCRSVYDKISNRLERRQRRRADDKKFGDFPCVLRVWNYWQQEPFPIYMCLYVQKCMDSVCG